MLHIQVFEWHKSFREEREEGKDDFKKQDSRGQGKDGKVNRWPTFWMIASQVDRKNDSV